MAEILIIKLSALGDLVQADGALRDIREHHQNDRITVMTTPLYREFMIRCPWVDEVFIDPRASRFNVFHLWSLRRRLHGISCDLVYDLQQVGRTRFYYHVLFPKVRWLGDTRGCTYYLKRPDSSCAADHFARHLRMAGIDVKHSLHCDVSWMANRVDDILGKHGLKPGYIVLIPGASDGHHDKRWPYFRELAERLCACGKQVVTVPGPAELELCRTIPAEMLVGEDGYYDIFSLTGIVRQAGYVVGNDTGPTHIAAQCRCRGLALYGGHVPPLCTGIQHTRFSWLQAENLADLGLEQVFRYVQKYIE